MVDSVSTYRKLSPLSDSGSLSHLASFYSSLMHLSALQVGEQGWTEIAGVDNDGTGSG